MALLVCYLIAADRLSDREKANVWKRFTAARSDENEDLPPPVEGPAFTAVQAKTVLATPALKAA